VRGLDFYSPKAALSKEGGGFGEGFTDGKKGKRDSGGGLGKEMV
jgi:hypothetical protein